jgi:hypothetical protein
VTSRGLDEAVRLLKARKGRPDEVDRPPTTVLSGPKHKPLQGQLDIFGGEHEPPADREPEERE